MKKIIFSLLAVSLLVLNSCDDDELIVSPSPITLSYSSDGNSTLESWASGELTELNADDYTDYFDNDSCLNYFNNETDPYCKSTKITFTDDQNLVFEYNSNAYELPYFFEDNTLMVTVEGENKALGIGNTQQLKIYGSLLKFTSGAESGCGGDEFHKMNFDGQFFLNSHENHNLPFSSPSEMEDGDTVIFYNKEYILE